MSRSEPSEAAIWSMIDRHDPHGAVEIGYRLEQHEEMLRGRDIHGEFFTRTPMLPICELDPSLHRDPADWVTSIKLKCGELEKTVDQVSFVWTL